MSNPALQTQSIWTEAAPFRLTQPLNNDIHADVCVIGGGIAGLTTAYLLTRAGRDVTLITDGSIGGGETGRTSAHLSWALDDKFASLEDMFGVEGARLAGESHLAAITQIEAIVQQEHIDCDFGWLAGFLVLGDGDTREDLEKEYEAIRRIGLKGVSQVDRVPLSSWDSGPALRFEKQAQFHPLKYLTGMADVLLREGCKIYTETRAVEITDRSSHKPCKVVTEGAHTVTASEVVVCTNTPVNDRVTMHTKQAAYRTYIVGLAVPRDSVPRALYWDTPDPYHYVRVVSPDNVPYDILVVGGEDHKTGQAEDTEQRFVHLEDWGRVRFPMATERVAHWSGQVLEPADSLAFIGRNPGDEHVYIATGDSGHGLTHGTLAGMIITDLVTGRENPWSDLYDPARKAWHAPKEFVRENLNVAKQYADWVSGSDVSSVDAIPHGSGAVFQRGLKHVAIYKDSTGQIHERSAVCPHLYCVVAWNDTEKSWDCPCHGSRFDAYGKVINGPAIHDLKDSDDNELPISPDENSHPKSS